MQCPLGKIMQQTVKQPLFLASPFTGVKDIFIRNAISGTRNSDKTLHVSWSVYCQLSCYITYWEKFSFVSKGRHTNN